MSQFSVGATAVDFTAIDMSFSDKGGPLEELAVGLLIDNATDWGALFSLRSWNVSTRPIPGGTVVYVDIGGGAGEGNLNIDNLDSHTAIMTSLSRDFVEQGSLRSKAMATFLITGP